MGIASKINTKRDLNENLIDMGSPMTCVASQIKASKLLDEWNIASKINIKRDWRIKMTKGNNTVDNYHACHRNRGNLLAIHQQYS